MFCLDHSSSTMSCIYIGCFALQISKSFDPLFELILANNILVLTPLIFLLHILIPHLNLVTCLFSSQPTHAFGCPGCFLMLCKFSFQVNHLPIVLHSTSSFGMANARHCQCLAFHIDVWYLLWQRQPIVLHSRYTESQWWFGMGS